MCVFMFLKRFVINISHRIHGFLFNTFSPKTILKVLKASLSFRSYYALANVHISQ